jgi:putative ATP-dependent endonuclease of OLD family
MPKKTITPSNDSASEAESTIQRPRLNKISVRNFRAIGSTPVTIELDDIVVLVGPNNSGKSSILRAYEVVMLHGSKAGELAQDDFPNSVISKDNPVEIELETVVYDAKAPGEKWIRKDPASGDMFVLEKWTWTEPGKPKKVGWDVAAEDWHEKEGPWGAAGVAQPARPEPHRIEAFDSPEKQASEVIKLLKDILTSRIKSIRTEELKINEEGEEDPNDYDKLLKAVSTFQKKVVEDTKEQVIKVEGEMNKLIGEIFPGQEVRFDARPEEDLDACLNFFKDAPQLLMGPSKGYQPPVEKQGSGARRTLLWAALRLLKEQAREKKGGASERPHILLIDEPEMCLHPNAVRDACRVLYDLPKSGNWQVMVTTHSPVFIDFWRDNTSIARVERKLDGTSHATTIYRPNKARLGEDDKECLKMLNLCDPYIAEFFFGGKSVIVEGDTEHTAFTYVIQREPDRFKNVHIIRARGKATIVSLCKIMNQFGSPYAVLHDSDYPTAKRKEKIITNPAWTQNDRILTQIKDHLADKRVRLVASIPTFEPAYFGIDVSSEKPYTAWEFLKENPDTCETVANLLEGLIDFAKPIPAGGLEWSEIGQLQVAIDTYTTK